MALLSMFSDLIPDTVVCSHPGTTNKKDPPTCTTFIPICQLLHLGGLGNGPVMINIIDNEI